MNCHRMARFTGTFLTLSWLVTVQAVSQGHASEPHRHPEGQRLESPFPSTRDSVATGAAVYAKHCAACHGPNGLGNGRLAAGMAAYGARPSDLTDDVWEHGVSQGEIFVVIRDGVGSESQMAGYGGKLGEADMWHIVHYIRSLSAVTK